MLKSLIGISLTLCLSACATPRIQDFGAAHIESLNVSVQELLGQPDFFDGHRVRVVGVAQFDFGFEGVSGIYVSSEDFKRSTNSYVEITSLSKELSSNKESLDSLSGQYVFLEGVFHKPAVSWPQEGGLCLGVCKTSGTIEHVSRVRQWQN
jgi:hypothetical protein